MKGLPIGISTLSRILEDGFVYIDKTEYAYALAKGPGRYFLSRPRRFGKSLFVDTLKEIFEGNEALFRGLRIHDKWDWSKKYPVIKIDFAVGAAGGLPALLKRIEYLLKDNAKRLGVKIEQDTDMPGMLSDLIKGCGEKYDSRVVLLVDEYDKPLLDNIEDTGVAAAIREELKSLYSVIKERDADLQFVFLTGVSKFSKVSIFSGINNLKDISLSEAFGAICGYTQEDLETTFGEHLAGVDWAELKSWYNGYNFLGEPVYNPFDILLFISEGKKYGSYWFETGTPSFLVRMIRQRAYFLPDLDRISAGEELLSSFELDRIEPVTLLFQAGYLTIDTISYKMGKPFYTLRPPNREVRFALTDQLFSEYSGITDKKGEYQNEVWDALAAGDLAALETAIRRLFAGIPWRNFTNNEIVETEGYYASVLYAFFSAINCGVVPEDITNHGQADLTLTLGNKVYVTEIKVLGDKGALSDGRNPALDQIRERKYAEKYQGQAGREIYELGMVFGRRERNLIGFGGCRLAVLPSRCYL
jgi:Protein of unknown function (DUF1703)./Predicted AAA-ATPase.